MKLTRLPILILFSTLASHVPVNSLPNSVMTPTELEKPNSFSNMIEDSTDSSFISSSSESQSLQTRNNKTLKCNKKCGTPSVADCRSFVDGTTSQGSKICVKSPGIENINVGDCFMALDIPGTDKSGCITPSELKEFGGELLDVCIETGGTGGCVTIPGSSGLVLCAFSNEQSCIAQDLGLM